MNCDLLTSASQVLTYLRHEAGNTFCMIKASELRIGNWYSNGSSNFTLSTSDFMDFLNEAQVNNGVVVNIFPVPLIPQVLEKAGFEKEVTEGSELIGPNRITRMKNTTWVTLIGYNDWEQTFYFQITDPGDAFDYCSIFSQETPESSCQIIRVPQYVHQLQNLLYALTGKELEFKP